MDGFVRNGAIELAVQSFGARTNPAIILSMGATASMLWWPEDLCQGLADRGYFVIRYDNRDTGQSTSVALGDATYAIEDMAADLVTIIDHFGFPSINLVGMSLGGLIGQMIAVAHAKRVRTLTLIGAQPLGWDGAPLPDISPEFLAHFTKLDTLDWNNRSAVIDFLLESARLSSVPENFDADRERRRIEAEMARTRAISSAFNHGSLARRENWTGRAATIKCPVLVLHGVEDPVAPIENGRAIADTIPFAHFQPLTGIGHELPATAIPLLTDLIATFVASGSPSTSSEVEQQTDDQPAVYRLSRNRRGTIIPIPAERRERRREYHA